MEFWIYYLGYQAANQCQPNNNANHRAADYNPAGYQLFVGALVPYQRSQCLFCHRLPVPE